MKPLSIVLLCLFVMAPFLLMMEIRCDALAAAQSLRSHYDAVLDNAVSDAAQELAHHTQAAGYGSESGTGMEIEADLAVELFFSSVCSGLGAESPHAQDRLRERIPVIVVAMRDQALLYLVRKAEGQPQGSRYRHTCVRVVPYAQNLEKTGPLVLFSMGREVRVLNSINGGISSGDWHQYDEMGCLIEENAALQATSKLSRLFETEEAFSNSRLRAIRDTITDQLETGMQVSTMADATGLVKLPAIQDASFRNAVTGVGLLAFVKGLPVGTQQAYQTLAFGGGRVVQRKPVTGWEADGQKRYCAPDCPVLLSVLPADTAAANGLRHFSNAQEASAEGYRPCTHCRP